MSWIQDGESSLRSMKPERRPDEGGFRRTMRAGLDLASTYDLRQPYPASQPTAVGDFGRSGQRSKTLYLASPYSLGMVLPAGGNAV